MTNTYLKSIFLLLCIFSFGKIYGQQVVYDFDRPEALDGKVPFDRAFQLKLVHIRPEVTAISATIYPVGVTNYRKLIKEAGLTKKGKGVNGKRIFLSNDVLLDNTLTPILVDSVTRNVNFADTGTQVIIPHLITLKPSTDYFIQINTYSKKALTDAESAAVLAALVSNDAIPALLNNFAKVNVANPHIPFDQTFSNFVRAIRENALSTARKINKDYTLELSDKDIISQLHGYAEMYNNIATAAIRIEEISRDALLNDSLKKVAKNNFVAQATNSMMQVNWSAIKEPDIPAIMAQLYHVIPKDSSLSVSGTYGLIAKNLKAAIESRDAANRYLTYSLIASSIKLQGVLACTYPEEFVKQASQFIASDLGLAYVWGIGRVNPYIGVQVALSPLDDSIPLREYRGFGPIVRSRLSFLIGISVDAVAKDSVRRGLIGGQALILGTGIKLWPWLKVNSGFYLYYREPINPTTAKDNLRFHGSPFVSLSIDVRVQSLLNGVGSAIFRTRQNM
ncbi:hypothetical protein [Chitinophaga eiseniae]|uniref:Uncharacterized protein n=1 Tax=Chitinophaga eiseniae TaxID=634771 RepID=A0A847SEI1_9BACT|nr:hypothetical protein [Chitinophaga eiseniae]NLR77365.1 hypothetical protein [Chitinophaga eiseniae]